jgi:hypothetical protein
MFIRAHHQPLDAMARPVPGEAESVIGVTGRAIESQVEQRAMNRPAIQMPKMLAAVEWLQLQME